MDHAHQATMDRVYRHMKHVYDLTRPLFLAGRRRLRSAVRAGRDQRVLEVGCGTARNLILLARASPGAEFVGIDISSEMLGLARDKVRGAGFDGRIVLFEGELGDYLAARAGTEPFDYVLFSYSLSMIPDWRGVLAQAIPLVRPDTGRLLIADFGGCESWPGPAKRRLYKNLSYFHVTPRADLADVLATEIIPPPLDIRRTAMLGGYGQMLEVSWGSVADRLEGAHHG